MPAGRCSVPYTLEGYTFAMSGKKLKPGDSVEWKSSQGVVHGTVEKELTSETTIKGHHVAASDQNPEYLVKSDKTGAKAAHKPNSLKKS